jgi:hypothetical protein
LFFLQWIASGEVYQRAEAHGTVQASKLTQEAKPGVHSKSTSFQADKLKRGIHDNELFLSILIVILKNIFYHRLMAILILYNFIIV